jgi:hypothetical protein
MMGLRKVDVAIIGGVFVCTGIYLFGVGTYAHVRDGHLREAETALKQTRSMAACVKDHGHDPCNGALKNLLARATRIGVCRDAQRAVEALTSDSPGRLDDAVKACRG